jgi:hypothetical protein
MIAARGVDSTRMADRRRYSADCRDAVMVDQMIHLIH